MSRQKHLSRQSQTSSSFARKLHVESLEDRRMLAVFTVTNLSDGPVSNSVSLPGSLRQAIYDANENDEADTINILVPGTINVVSQFPNISDDLVIKGPGANWLTLDAGGGATTNPGDGYRIFRVLNSSGSEDIQVAMSGLTLTGGDPATNFGGAIGNNGDLTLNAMVIEGNTSSRGGAVENNGTLAISNSTLSDNHATHFGGGIYSLSNAQLAVHNSTISGNTAGTRGGGIYNSSLANISNSTITANTSGQTAGGIYINDIFNPIHLSNSIVADNSAPNIANLAVFDLATNTNNLIDVDPLLGPLADNGSPTRTHALLPGSPALDAVVAGPAPTPIHDYQLNGSLADDLGGPSLVHAGGVLTATGYDFEADQGLSLSGANISPDNYTIEIDFSFDAYAVNHIYQSIINFKNLTSDNGLYSFIDVLTFYDSGRVAQTGSIFTANTMHNLVFSRDSATNLVSAQVDGTEVWSYYDTNQQAVLSGPERIIHFFQDNGTEEEAGFVDRIRIYDSSIIHTDQRGLNRLVDSSADTGAYEAQVAPSADFDTDLDVDGADFLAWQRGFGKANAVRADGNSDDDTDTDASDLAAWKVSYGLPQTPLNALTSDTEQPEQLTASLIDAAIALETLETQTDDTETLVVVQPALEAALVQTSSHLDNQPLGSYVAAESDALHAEKSTSNNADQRWLAEELLERVFG